MKKYFALGGRMTKWKGRVASVAPNLASVSVVALVASGAMATAESLDHGIGSVVDLGATDDYSITAPLGAINITNGATYALSLADLYTGSLDNAGTIIVRDPNTEDDLTYATGILVTGDLGDSVSGGYIDNALGGSIIVDVQHLTSLDPENAAYMYAAGIYVDDVMDSDSQITNAGAITVTADGSSSESVYAYGIAAELGSDADAMVSNSGTISVDATGMNGFVDAVGISQGYTSTYTVGADTNISFFGATLGDIANSGDITVSATAYGTSEGSSADAYATGIYTTLMSGGSIDNSGTVTVTATIDDNSTKGGSALAHGIWVEQGIDGTSTITSNGTLDVTAIGSGGGEASAFGIEIGNISESYDNSDFGLMDGTMTIDGDVSATAIVTGSTSAGARAFGVMASYAGHDSVIETTGTISASASGEYNSGAFANGVTLGISDGTVTLGGDIDATATVAGVSSSSGYAAANGVEIFWNRTGSQVETTGTITVDAHVEGGGSAAANGVVTVLDLNLSAKDDPNYGLADGVLKLTSLNGTISVDASGSSALAAGSLSYFSFATATVNNGTIDATATATNVGGADGAMLLAPLFVAAQSGGLTPGDLPPPFDGVASILFGSLFEGSGDINGAVGMGSLFNFASATVNTGDITVDFDLQGTSEASGLYGAAGMGVMANYMGLVANTGTITASATDAPAAGMAVARNVGFVVNSGTIHADADGTEGQAIGVFVDGLGTFINTGTIVAADNGDNAGIAVYATNRSPEAGVNVGTTVLATGGFLEGEIRLSGEVSGPNSSYMSLDVLGTAGSAVNWTVYGEDANTSDDLYMGDASLGTTVFKDHVEPLEWQFTTIDSSQFAAQRETLADASTQSSAVQADKTAAALASGVAGKFEAYGAATRSNMTYAATGQSPITLDPVGMWLGVLMDHATEEEAISAYSNMSGGTLERDVSTSTLSAGGTTQTDKGVAVGFGIGGQSGSATMSSAYMTSSDTTYNGAYAGVTVATQVKDFTLVGGLTAGTLSNSYDRWENNNLVLGGIDQVSGTYNSTYVTLQGGTTGHFNLGHGITLSPGVTLRYTNGKVDAYSETGDETAAWASVAAQSFGIMESQLDLGIAKSFGSGSLSAAVSITNRALRDGDNVDVTMIGDQETVSGFAADTKTRTVTIGYSADLSAGMTLNFEAARVMGSDNVSGTTVSGGFNFAF